jgi:hypothetical protein
MQLVVIGFETTEEFKGEILRELEAIRAEGVIRLIDLLFVAKDEVGEIMVMEDTWLDEGEEAEFGALIGALIGLGAGGIEGAAEGAAAGAVAGVFEVLGNVQGLTPDAIQASIEEMEPGTAAAIMIFEHAWAADFAGAIKDAGGAMLAQGFLTRDALFLVGAELEAMIETEIVIEGAEAMKKEAMLDALTAVAAGEAIKGAVAADVLRTLIMAGLIEEAAIEDAIDTLVAVELIEEAAITAAAEEL